MSFLELFLIGVGLSMDAFAVSITDGMSCAHLKRAQTFGIAECFGIFQGLMPVIGFFVGKAFERYICAFDHWIALVLLGYIGGKMILDALHDEEEAGEFALTGRLLLTQGIATSIDALAVGVSLAALPGISIWLSAALICCTTFVFSLAGVLFGRRMGQGLGSRAQLAGGILLIGIGVKIFAEHMLFGG